MTRRIAAAPSGRLNGYWAGAGVVVPLSAGGLAGAVVSLPAGGDAGAGLAGAGWAELSAGGFAGAGSAGFMAPPSAGAGSLAAGGCAGAGGSLRPNR